MVLRFFLDVKSSINVRNKVDHLRKKKKKWKNNSSLVLLVINSILTSSHCVLKRVDQRFGSILQEVVWKLMSSKKI